MGYVTIKMSRVGQSNYHRNNFLFVKFAAVKPKKLAKNVFTILTVTFGVCVREARGHKRWIRDSLFTANLYQLNFNQTEKETKLKIESLESIR